MTKIQTNIMVIYFKNSIYWDTRIVSTSNDKEYKSLKSLLNTSLSKSIQNKLMYNDVKTYINDRKAMCITNRQTLVYFADLENQGGSGASSRVVKSAGGGNELTLYQIYQAALNDNIMGKYKPRRNQTYNKIKSIIPN